MLCYVNLAKNYNFDHIFGVLHLFVVNSVGFLSREEQVSLQVQVEKVRLPFFMERWGHFCA